MVRSNTIGEVKTSLFDFVSRARGIKVIRSIVTASNNNSIPLNADCMTVTFSMGGSVVQFAWSCRNSEGY